MVDWSELTSQSMHDLLLSLSQTKHDTRLCHPHTLSLSALKYLQTPSERSSSVSDERREFFACLDVVGIDVQAGFGDDCDMVHVAVHVTCEGLD